MLPLFGQSIELSVALDHPAYDSIYLALALREDIQFVTADESLVRKLKQNRNPIFGKLALPLSEFA